MGMTESRGRQKKGRESKKIYGVFYLSVALELVK
jgi:hypothetical protein